MHRLIDLIQKYRLIKQHKKIAEAVTLSHEVVMDTSVSINEKSRSVVLEYTISAERERGMVQALLPPGETGDSDTMPHRVIFDFLYRLSQPLYYHIAKENQWPLTQVRYKRLGRRGDYAKKDTVVKISLHPLLYDEFKESVMGKVKERYIALRLQEKEAYKKGKKPKIEDMDLPEREALVSKLEEEWEAKGTDQLPIALEEKLQERYKSGEKVKSFIKIFANMLLPGEERRAYLKTCPACKKQYTPTRANQIYCGEAACKMRRHRKREKEQRKRTS